jgi:hypothetical protein
MVRRTADVVHVILAQFLLEPRHAAPGDVLPAVVGEHLFRRPIFGNSGAIRFQHMFAGLTAVEAKACHIPGMVVHESDHIDVLTQQRELRDVALPHLVRRGTFEELRRLRLPFPSFGPGGEQSFAAEFLAYRLRTGLQAEEPPQRQRDPPHTVRGILPLQRRDLRLDRLGCLRMTAAG